MEASLFPLIQTVILQEEQVKQGMLQCQTNQVVDARPAKKKKKQGMHIIFVFCKGRRIHIISQLRYLPGLKDFRKNKQ